eukprot:2916177-Prymnesium_polylepis.1
MPKGEGHEVGERGSSTTGPRAPSLVLLTSTSRSPVPYALALALGRLDLCPLVHVHVAAYGLWCAVWR